MFLSDFHRECLKLARADDRWMYGEADTCGVCKRNTAYIGPSGEACCPWCWNWKGDEEAEQKPKLDPTPLPVPDLARMQCLNLAHCGSLDVPKLEWRWAGGKKRRAITLGAFCKGCSRWIRWCDRSAFAVYAPPLPIDTKGSKAMTLFGAEDEAAPPMSEKERLNARDSSLGIKTPRYTPPPPPEDGKPITIMELSRLEGELWYSGGRLYLNEKA